MKYIKEDDLRKQFWKGYNYRKNIIAYQFECPCRYGNIDIVTVELVKDSNGETHIEFVGFEFKLDNITKAFAQAAYNSKYCHKSFIVIPAYKENLIRNKYSDYFKKYKNIGVITVDHPDNGGKWHLIQKSSVNPDSSLELNQNLLKLCCHVI